VDGTPATLISAIAALIVAIGAMLKVLLDLRRPKPDPTPAVETKPVTVADLLGTVQTLTLELDDARRAEARERAARLRCEDRLQTRRPIPRPDPRRDDQERP
jgi:hypothetical protein